MLVESEFPVLSPKEIPFWLSEQLMCGFMPVRPSCPTVFNTLSCSQYYIHGPEARRSQRSAQNLECGKCLNQVPAMVLPAGLLTIIPEEFPCCGLVLLCHRCAPCGGAAVAELQ